MTKAKYEGEKLEIVRVFNAPRETVWKAWTDSKIMADWSCPEGFMSTVSEADLRVGGIFRGGMKSEFYEGVATGEYVEIVEPEKLVFTHTWEDVKADPNFETLVTVTFTESDGKTTMTFIQEGFNSVERRDSHADGWGQSFDKLKKLLNQDQPLFS